MYGGQIRRFLFELVRVKKVSPREVHFAHLFSQAADAIRVQLFLIVQLQKQVGYRKAQQPAFDQPTSRLGTNPETRK
ncbi:hypothetical protein GCM10023149_29300 [Mucilaginibacter gynuensis]|uniref:Uncharacterized protein n=1 Tax=Mucilaginibacter gynuensis TaxID=1302236 RepID=A0ABP8GLU3_9SPHI